MKFIACNSATFEAGSGGSGASSGSISGDTMTTNKWHWITFTANGASSILRVNGAATASGNIGTGKLANYKLGFNLNSGDGNFGLVGRIAETFVYTNSALSTNQIIALEYYLTNKYGAEFGLTP